ncbi:MAG: hypothetical protein FJ102_21945, partial [Deltaproteobacteria bacterium]|nr:hypothetical protein [Deltaproteobacteria bacterium]
PVVVPPAPAAPPPVAPAPQGATPEKLRAYKQRRLVRGPLNYTIGGGVAYAPAPGPVAASGYRPLAATQLPAVTVVSWGVFDGGGAPFSAPEFARVVGDRVTSVRLDDERQKARNTVLGTAIASGALAVGAFAAFGALQPLPSFIGTDESIAAEDEYQQVQATNGALMTIGVASVLGSITTLTAAVSTMPALNARHRWVYRQYAPAEADLWNEKHNAQLREELGLGEADVQQIDLQSRQLAPTIQLALAPGALSFNATF